MFEQAILYRGCSSGIFEYQTFVQFMEGKGQKISLENDSLYRMEIYVLEPATTLIYSARKRIVPRELDLWSVTISLSGYGVETVKKRLIEGMQNFKQKS